MTPEDFEKAVAETRFTASTKKMLHMILIDGVKDSEAARRFNVTRARVSNAKARLMRAHKKLKNIKDDWVTITITVPPEMAKKIKKQIEEL